MKNQLESIIDCEQSTINTEVITLSIEFLYSFSYNFIQLKIIYINDII